MAHPRRALVGRLAVLVMAFALVADACAQPARSASPVTNIDDTVELHRAARSGDLTTLQRLLVANDPDARDVTGRTALIEAASGGRVDVMRLLLSSGADINTRTTGGRTPLIEATESGHVEAVRLLIQSGADLNANQRGVGTALETAERNGHRALALMLRQAGAAGTGRSPGDKVCVQPWQGNGYCGSVVDVDKTKLRIRVTSLVGCRTGCAANPECSGGRNVGGRGGVAVGEIVNTVTWCLTATGVGP